MASPRGLSQKPGVQKIVDNVKECVDELKRDFNDTHRPITDDSQVLQRFSVNLEFLLRHEQIEKSGFLGGKKDYWNYFIEGLNSVKGVNDGLKFVKSRSELTTNQGRGRAFIRFCLMYQRLADCLQLCTSNSKLTSQWYKPTSVWRNSIQASYLTSILYDLNDVTFDLGAQGYDLDNGWPTFSRSDMAPSGGRWNISSMSRSSSISSLSQSMFSPGSSFMSSSYIEPEVQQISEHGEGRFDTYSTTNTENDETDSMPGTNLPNGLNDSVSNGVSGDMHRLEPERDDLLAEVNELKSKLASSNQQSEDLQGRVSELEERNKQLVGSLNQLAQDQSAASTSHIEQLSKYQELMSKYSELEAYKFNKEAECNELLSAKSALDVQTAALSQQCAEKDELITQLSSDKDNLEDNLSTIANSLMEKSSLVEKLAVSHRSELSKLQDSYDTLVTNHTSLQEQHQALQDSNFSLQSQFNSVSIDINNLQTSHKQLELTQTGATDYTESLQGQLAAAQSEYKTSQQEVLRLQTEAKQLKAKIDSATAANLEQKEVNSKLTNQCAELVTVTAALQAEILEKKKESKKWQDKFAESEKEKSRVSSQLTNKEELIKVTLANRDSLLAENNKLKSELLNARATVTSIQSECNALREHNSTQESENKKLQKDFSALQETNNQLKIDCDSANRLYATAKEELSSRDVSFSEIQEQRNQQEDENIKAKEQLEALANQLSALRLAADESTAEKRTVLDQCDRQKEQISEMEQQLMNIHTAHSALQASYQDMETSSSALSAELTAIADKHGLLQTEYESKSGECKELEERLVAMQQLMAANQSEQQQDSMQLSLKCEQLTRQNNDFQSRISAINDDLAALSGERDMLKAKVEEEQQTKLSLTTAVGEVNSEIDSLKSTLKSLKSEALEKNKELSDVQTCFDSTKRDLLNKQSIFEQQIGALRFQISSQQMEADLALEGYKTQQEDVHKMSQTITKQERLIASIQLQLDTMIDERSLETDIHQRQIDELVVMLDEKEAELLSLTNEMTDSREHWGTLVENNNELKQSLIELKLGQGEKLAKAENELHQLREDNVVLKKRLVKLIKDKETLWQATDDLMSKQQQQKNVVWVDSSEVHNCMGCNSTFSMLLRKHHCRVCGKVYCWQCSNNWVLTTSGSGKKKERCCNHCYIEQSDINLPDSLNSSTLTHENTVDSVTIPPVTRRHDSPSPTSEVSSQYDDSLKPSPERQPVTPPDTEDMLHNGDHPSTSQDADEVEDNGPALEENLVEEDDGPITITVPPENAPTTDIVESKGSALSGENETLSTELDTSQSATDGEAALCTSQPNEEATLARLMESLKEEYEVVIGTDTTQSSELTQVSMKELSQHSVCVVVNKEDTTLAWKLMSQSKPVYFQLTFKPYTTSFSQGSETLIPECKCRSHKQEVQGEMISHNNGLYIFSFINKSERKVNLQYLISMSQS